MQEHEDIERGEVQSDDEQVICSNKLLAKIRERMAQRRRENPEAEDIRIEEPE